MVLETLLRPFQAVLLAAALTLTPTVSSYSAPPPKEKDHIYVPHSFGAEKRSEINPPELFLRALGFPPKEAPDDCGLKRVGVMGASNTVGKSYVRYLRELCPSTEFIVRAHGGYSPREQLEYLLPRLLEEKIDFLIVSPSGNDLEKHDHTTAVREIVGEAKGKGIATAVLSVSPRYRHYQEWKEFNDYLLHEKLGVPSLIDTVVDISSPLLKKGSKYGCGYCYRDGVHWDDLGDQRVAVQIYNTLWAKKKGRMPE